MGVYKQYAFRVLKYTHEMTHLRLREFRRSSIKAIWCKQKGLNITCDLYKYGYFTIALCQHVILKIIFNVSVYL
jgi:hypothetical protein